jgi:branched-chain amino acid transport system substrate-binding protein
MKLTREVSLQTTIKEIHHKMNELRRFAFVSMIVSLVVGLSACDELVSILSTTDIPEMEGVQGDISIGVVVPLTGVGAGPYGFSMQNGFELAKEEINNAQLGDATISFITVDDMTTVDGAVSAFQDLADQGVQVVVGYTYTFQVDHVFPLAEENEVVAFSSVSSGAGRSSLSQYAFRTGLATNILNPAGVKVSQARLGYTRVAIIYDEVDPYATSGYEDLSAALEEIGVEVVTTQTMQKGDIDFSEQMAAIMASEAEAVVISALSAEIVQIMSQGREAGIPSSVRYIVPDLTANEVAIVGDAAEGAITFINWIETSGTPGNQAFIRNYRETYGIEPDPWAAQSYATLYILAAAIARAGSTDSTAIRDALAQTMDFDTILGPFSFDPNGEANYEPIIAVVKDGQIVMFEDSDMLSDDDMSDDGMTDDGMMDDDMSDDDMTDDDMSDDGMSNDGDGSN